MKSGIYLVTNTVDGKIYVGQSVNMEARWWQHRWGLKRGVHRNIHLQRAFALDGEQAFVFSVLEHCEPAILDEREQHYLDTLNPVDNGYNIMRHPRSAKGYKHSEEARRKIAESHKTRAPRQPLTEETKTKMRGPRGPNKATKESYERSLEKRRANGYKPLTEERKRRISEGMKRAKQIATQTS